MQNLLFPTQNLNLLLLTVVVHVLSPSHNGVHQLHLLSVFKLSQWILNLVL